MAQLGPGVDRVRVLSVRSTIPLLLALSLPGCLQLTSDAPDAGTTPAAPAAAEASAPPTKVTGAQCAIDSLSGVTLCTSIDLCPGLAVDHDVYPDCGFRVAGSSIDLECVCGDVLCGMGTALRCSDARDLLAQGTELSVCARQSDGQCAPRTPTKPAASACDRACAAECSGVPGCVQLCGC